jgi:hypothetical protein
VSKYTGLDPKLRLQVLERDRWRCRWCGVTNAGGDLHHIRYRRGFSDDVPENLITLDRDCHGFVHGNMRNGSSISKEEAQGILFMLIDQPGVTGTALLRQMRRRKETT